MSGTSNTSNPLASPQREHSGATTYGKFEYQYHWALCKALNLHNEGKEYVVFVEYHEDVIVGDSLDADQVQFHFHQVKNYAGGPWKIKKIITRQKADGSKEKSSILAKMISGVKGKPFYGRLLSLGLVNATGFELELATAGLSLSTIFVDDLSPAAKAQLAAALKAEIGDDDIPGILCFIVSDLPTQRFQETSIGHIAGCLESKIQIAGIVQKAYIWL
ncbi:dsDNA nuclease domain-containing protein [Azohydromonas australica]|uniref:dsDNA nuclease domain-containing protein n=1 Tax=Azohydromonas australica TaxID=364039 RepID=UPI00146C6A01|nr:dsDNA nuclease domain-containing protein [Azohydromonas australica]